MVIWGWRKFNLRFWKKTTRKIKTIQEKKWEQLWPVSEN